MSTCTKTALLLAVLAFSTLAASPPGKEDAPVSQEQLSQQLRSMVNKQQNLSTLLTRKNPSISKSRKEDGEPPVAGPKQPDDEVLLRNANISTDATDLLEFFRRRTLSDGDRPGIESAVRMLGSDSYHKREDAMQSLINKGPMAINLLREAVKDDDPEISRRAEKCLGRILQDDVEVEVAAAAARQLALRRPAGAVEALFAFLPTAQALGLTDTVLDVLGNLAAGDEKEQGVLVKGLQDPAAVRRAAAAEVLCKADAARHKEAVHKLLQDADVHVRLRVARCLVFAGDASAIPAMIESLPQLSFAQASQVDDVLFRIAEGKNPPMVSVGRDDNSRKRCRDAWFAWWQKEGKKADLARLTQTPPLLGHTLVVLLDEGRVVDLDSENQPRWSVEKLEFPLDAQLLSGDRVLVAEYNGRMVTERNIKGEILWKKEVTNPLVAQRLTNGNTFIVTDAQMMEYDREDKEVVSISMEPGERIMKALKLPNNEICCLLSPDQFSARIVRLDAAGRQLSSFPIELSMRLFGGRIHMLADGHVLVPHNGEGKVVEYDARGKAVWEVTISQPIAAFRLANGNTLVTSMQTNLGATEFNRAGTEVWRFRAQTRVTRAMRR